MRTALWRALHVELDDPPHLIDDEIGLALVDPEEGWRDRGDMHPVGTLPYRAAIVARTRFVEDLLVEEGIGQYVLLGAGLDTFAQRHGELAGRCECSRSISRARRPGSGSAWTSSATACPGTSA